MTSEEYGMSRSQLLAFLGKREDYNLYLGIYSTDRGRIKRVLYLFENDDSALEFAMNTKEVFGAKEMHKDPATLERLVKIERKTLFDSEELFS